MDEQTKDSILDRVRKIESIAEIMEICFENLREYPASQAFECCMQIICEEAEGIRNLVRNKNENRNRPEESEISPVCSEKN